MGREQPKSGKSAPRDSKAPRKRRVTRHAPSTWEFLVQTYASADPRSLGVFRILLGCLLFWDVARRWPDLAHHYANTGWLTNHFALYRPMSDHLFSVYLAFSTLAEVKALALVHMAVSLCLLAGWRTKLMQVLSVVLIVSLNSRNIMLENGGYVVLHLLVVWSMFLPLGRRLSVDAWLVSYRRRRETTLEALNDFNEDPRRWQPVRSIAVTALILQFAIIYYFNVIHKTGPAWKDGSAVYYFFQQDRMVTWFGAWIRHYTPLFMIRAMTYGTLVLESAVVFCLLSPAYTRITRMVGWLIVLILHGSIDAVVQLGPFSYAMFIVHSVFIPRNFWEWWARRRLEHGGRRRVYIDPDSAFAIWFARFIKRLSLPGMVRFEGVRPGRPFVGRKRRLEHPITHDEVASSLVVSNASGRRRWSGVSALAHLVDALAVPRFFMGWQRWEALANFVERRLDGLVSGESELPKRLGMDRAREKELAVDDASAGRRLVQRTWGLSGQALCLFVMVCCTSQVLMENRAIPAALKPKTRPEWMTAVVVYPRLFQGWSMFAPDPPHDDGKVVVEGRTRDGRRFDPFTQSEPDYDIDPPEGFKMNQIWGDFHRRIWQRRFKPYWSGFEDYLKRHHEITGKAENALVGFEVYYVSEVVPPYGQPPGPVKKEQLFSWGQRTTAPAKKPEAAGGTRPTRRGPSLR